MESDLDEIWLYTAKESGSIDIANRLIDTITDRFVVLSSFPYIGRSREDDFGAGYRSLAVGEYVIVYCVQNGDALVLQVCMAAVNSTRFSVSDGPTFGFTRNQLRERNFRELFPSF